VVLLIGVQPVQPLGQRIITDLLGGGGQRPVEERLSLLGSRASCSSAIIASVIAYVPFPRRP
jgi:hypothetical protein